MKLIIYVLLISPNLIFGFLYGKHIPNALQAVSYIYGPNGTWRNMNNIHYVWNYYEQYATPNHPFNKNQLINAANGVNLYTCRDANGYLICDANRDGELDSSNCGFAFHEHNARGVNGTLRGQPFTNFWFDDNWLARYMSQAYGAEEPKGLVEQFGFVRWKILGGDSTNWQPYNSDYYDTLSLDGLYYLSTADPLSAYNKWARSLAKSGAVYDSQNQQYLYPNVHENYHIGLWKILTDLLYNVYIKSNDDEKRIALLQHSISLRSTILSNQEVDENGNKLGWVSNIGDSNTLMNTESIAVNVLALGTWMKFGFEVYASPMEVGNGYFVRKYNAVSAVVNLSPEGYVFQGPMITGFLPFLNPGKHEAKFFIRSPRPVDQIASVYVRHGVSGDIHSELIVNKNHFNGDNLWSDVTIEFNVVNGDTFSFGLYWTGKENIDVCFMIIN